MNPFEENCDNPFDGASKINVKQQPAAIFDPLSSNNNNIIKPQPKPLPTQQQSVNNNNNNNNNRNSLSNSSSNNNILSNDNPFLTSSEPITRKSLSTPLLPQQLQPKQQQPQPPTKNNNEELNPFLTMQPQPQQPQPPNNNNDELNPFLTIQQQPPKNNNEELNPFLTSIPTPTPTTNKQQQDIETNTFLTIKQQPPQPPKNNNEELNPFLNQDSTSAIKKPLPPPPQQVVSLSSSNIKTTTTTTSTNAAPIIAPIPINNNNNNVDVDGLIRNVRYQMNKEFESKENIYKSNLMRLAKEKESIQLSLDQLNNKYLSILEKNEELKNNNDFKNKYKDMLQSSTTSTTPTTSLPSPPSPIQPQQSFNLSLELKRLNNYKTIKDKKEILKRVVASMDMDSTLNVLHYLYNSLNCRLFLDIVNQQGGGLYDMFLGYLRRIGKFNDVIAIQKQINQRSEEIYINLYMALQERDINRKQHLLMQWHENYKQFPTLEVYLKQIETFISVLDRQIKIEQFDSNNQAAKGDPIFQRVPRFNLIGKSLSDTIYYCLLYHPNAPKDKLSSPISYKDLYGISNKLYLFNQLSSRSKLQDWNYITNILPKKKGLFTKSFQSELPIESFVECLTLNYAPLDMVESVARMIEGDLRRYECCMQYKLYRVALESLISIKKLKNISQFRIKVQQEYGLQNNSITQLLDEALSNPKIKWKQ